MPSNLHTILNPIQRRTSLLEWKDSLFYILGIVTLSEHLAIYLWKKQNKKAQLVVNVSCLSSRTDLDFVRNHCVDWERFAYLLLYIFIHTYNRTDTLAGQSTCLHRASTASLNRVHVSMLRFSLRRTGSDATAYGRLQRIQRCEPTTWQSALLTLRLSRRSRDSARGIGLAPMVRIV